MRPRPLSVVLALALTFGLFVAPATIAPVVAQAAVPSALALAKTAPASILAGQPATYQLHATNPSSAPGATQLYNLSFRDVLDPGVTYKAGTTLPTDLGDPRIFTSQEEFPVGSGTIVNRQTLVWDNVADLAVDGDYLLTYQATPDPVIYKVAGSVSNSAQPFASTNPRRVPQFDSKTGDPVDSSTTTAGPVQTATSTIAALDITKLDTGSAEGALLRGAHNEVSTYTLTVRNNSVATTTGVTVVDYLPAGLEFLGCSGDHSSNPEYPGAGALPTKPCSPTPISITTVTDPTPGLTGVFTRVEWSLPDLAAGAQQTISYPAAVPLRENTATWPGETPSGSSLHQGANLDNNTGPSTRQNGVGNPLRNSATVSGTYQGTVAPGGSTASTASTSHTVLAKDVRVQKSASTSEFVIGAKATFTLDVQSSQYVTGSDVVLSDVIPNGICPLVSQSQWDDLVAAHPSLAAITNCVGDADDAPTASDSRTISFSSVTYDESTGAFTVTFTPLDGLAAASSLEVTYRTRLLAEYPGGDLAGSDTSSGDTFVNRADVTATTTPIAGTGETGQQQVTDGSSAKLITDNDMISKTMRPQAVPITGTYSCTDGTFVDPSTPELPAAQTLFAPGDLACFELTVDFAHGVLTRNPVVKDFLPENTTYVAGSATLASSNTLPADQVVLDDSSAADGVLSWTLGSADEHGTHYVGQGLVFSVRIAVRVGVSTSASDLDLVGNLMKFRAENSNGQVTALRDRVAFTIGSPVPVSVAKTVLDVNGVAPADPENARVETGDLVAFQVGLTNAGTASAGSDRPVSDLQVWDVLPAPFTCADVAVQAGLECRDPDHFADVPAWTPTVTSGSILRFTVPGPIAAGTSQAYTYHVTVPTVGPNIGTAVRPALVNTAYVSAYSSQTNDGGAGVTFHPKSNIDDSIPAVDQLVPPASDSAGLATAPATAGKTAVSAISTPGNTGDGQAAIGELVTYTLRGTVPAGLTVTNATLTDAVPTGVELLNATYPPTTTFYPDAGSSTTAPMPDGFSVVAPTAGAGNGTQLVFPASYSNTTATDQAFALTVTGRLLTSGNTQGQTRVNTATLQFTTTGGVVVPVQATATTTVREPAVKLVKSVTPAGPYAAGQTVTYQLAASNGTSSTSNSVAYDTWLTDCLPAGLTFVQATGGATVTTDPGTGTGAGGNGCATGTTRITWHAGDIASGATATLNYQARIADDAAAGRTYTNSASVSAVSVPAARDNPQAAIPDGAKAYTTATSATITVNVPKVTKTVNPTVANVGQTVIYTATTSIPLGINLYSTVLRDTLPAGIDLTSVTTTSVTCSRAGGTTCAITAGAPTVSGRQLTWTFGDIASDTVVRTVTVVYTARVADVAGVVAGTAVKNSAGVQWATTSGGTVPGGISGTAAVATLTVQEPAVHIAKSVSDTTPAPGDSFTYTLSVTNGGKAGDSNVGPAYNVTVSDTVPTGVIVATVPPGATITGQNPDGSGGIISWTIAGPLVSGGSAVTLTYQATLAASGTLSSATALPNTATVTDVYSQPGSTGRHSTPNTTGTATITPDFPKVVPTKTAITSSPTLVGSPFTWQITLTNSGTAPAFGLSATDTLPANWAYTPGTTTIVTPSGTATTDPVVTGRTLAWSGILPVGSAGLAPGQSVTIRFTSVPQPEANTSQGMAFAHTNTVVSTATDATGATGNMTGSYASGTGSAIAQIATADLRLAKSAGTFVAGSTGTWTLTVSNAGPDAAVGPFQVTDHIPSTLTAPDGSHPALTVTGASGAGWSCSTVGFDVTCQRTSGTETLASTSSFPAITVTVAIPANAPSGSTAANSGSVTSPTYDPNQSNNTASATGTVTTSADLQTTKTLVGSMVAGQNATWRVLVTNLGPSVSLASAEAPITLTDTLPAGVSFVSATGDGWTCPSTPTGSTITCSWTTTLAASGASAATSPLTIVGAVSASQTAAVTNSAKVTPVTTDPVPSNNTSSVTTTPSQSADLGVVKTLVDKTTPVVAGTDRSYLVTVTNYGVSDARDVVVVDTLPASTTWTGTWSDHATWTCAQGSTAREVRCTLTGTISGVGTPSVPLTIGVRIPADYDTTAPLLNTAKVSASTPDPVTSNNTATDDSSATAVADLGIAKTLTGPAAVAGSATAYTLQVTNHGPSVTRGLTTVTDVLPSGMTPDPAHLPSGTGWTCSVSSLTITCTTSASLALGAAAPITVPVLIDQATQGTVTNRANVTGTLDDPVPGNNAVELPTPVAELATVSVTKSTSTPTVIAGTSVTYTVTVVNAGPSTARGLTLRDTAPVGMTVTSITGADWTCTGIDCTRAVLPVGKSTLTVVASVNASVARDTVLTNVVDITVTTPHGPGEPQWQGTAPVTVDTMAGVSVDKSHDAASDPVLAGTTATFTLVVRNAGPSDAVTPITITDTLPAGMSYVSASGPWTCTPGAGHEVSCVFTGGDRVVAKGSLTALTMIVAVDASVTAPSLMNAALVTTGTHQDPSVDPHDTDTVPIARQADLAIAKSHVGSALAGTDFTWTLTVTNLGPSVSRADSTHPITVVDTLPHGTSYVSGGSADWACGASGQTVTCLRTTDMPVATPGSSFPVTVAVDPAQRDDLANTATVSPGSTPEPDTEAAHANNTANDTVPVTTQAALAVSKSHAAGTSATAGSTFTWTVTVENSGPSESWADADHPIVLTDTLPAGTSFVSATGDFACAASTGQEVRCERATSLAPGTSTIAMVVKVAPDTVGDLGDPVNPETPAARFLTNTVAITAVTTPDPTGPDTATDTVPLGFSADLAITKTHDPSAVPVPGQPFTWTLQVSNLGPSVSRATPVAPITVSDTLPSGVVPVSAAGAGWTCTVVDQEVSCVLGASEAPADLPLGNAPAITVVAHVDASWTQPISNTAAVAPGATHDPNLANNTATDPSVPPVASSLLTVTKSHDPATVRIGDPLDFAVQVSNTGPSTARGVVVRDTLPAGLVPVGGTGEGFTCTVSLQDVICSYDDEAGMLPLSAGGVVHALTVTATVTAQAYPTVDNIVLVTATTQPPDTEPVRAVDPVVVPPQVDLAITKTLSGPLIVGQTAQYALTVTNAGPTEDPGPITVTDVLPDGLVATEVTGGTCTIGVKVTCELPAPLAVGASAQVLLTVQVGPAAYPKVSNTATVTTASEDTDPGNNTSSLVSPVTPLAGMTVVKKAMPGPADNQVTWTITVANSGPNPNPDPLTLSDQLPAGLTVVSVSPAAGWTCTTEVTCRFDGPFAAGRSDEITVVTAVTAAGGTTVTNTATLTWPGHSASARAGWTTPVVPDLPSTGSSISVSPWVGLGLLLGGLVLIAVARRRSEIG